MRLGTNGAPIKLRSISTAEHMMAELVKGFNGVEEGTRKGKLPATLKQAAPALNVSDEHIYLLDQLMVVSQEQDLELGRRPIVWPSNDMSFEGLGIQTS